MCTFGNFLAPVLIAAHTANKVDFGDEPENENYESDKKGPHPGLNKMIDLLKKTIGYILLYILKYTRVVRAGIQEEFNKEVCRKPLSLAFIHGIFKIQEICDEVVHRDLLTLWYVPDHFITQEMSNEIMRNNPGAFQCIPDCFKTQEM